ncbi:MULTISPECIES: glycosyltransferase [Spirulina sp. CCY15215]|uniref:glycosyltransferase n=1 Tax=Spirulina sp. CCY15215 TaxID=2767591 RepID=UPI00194FD4C2|nr:glycosyltransferase [Spirulina major]
MLTKDSKTLLQIVPSLPPSIGGIGDYALNLARQIARDFAIQTHFIIGNPHGQGASKIESFAISQVSQRSPQSLLSLLPRECPIFLNYEGYGYAQRGYPLWLLQGLQQWRKESQQPLITMFHEIYPYHHGPPWTSSFWLSPWQKKLATKLLNISDRAITSKQNYATLLQQLSHEKNREILVLPVFSNIGEPQEILPLKQRRRRIIIFGHYNSRTLVYRHNLSSLERVCQALEIQEVYDIGVPTGLQLPPVNDITVTEMGVTSADTISQLMLEAVAGFLCFIPPEYLAKSTVFASYCAHGLIPIITGRSTLSRDGLERDRHYYLADSDCSTLNLKQGQTIANCAREWYSHHSLQKQAREIFSLFADFNINRNSP